MLVDIDECLEDIDGCGQRCSNTVGSYTCNCNSGYRLDSDRHTCNGNKNAYTLAITPLMLMVL